MKYVEMNMSECPNCKRKGWASKVWSGIVGKYLECIHCNARLFYDGEPIDTIEKLHMKIKDLDQRLQSMEKRLQPESDPSL